MLQQVVTPLVSFARVLIACRDCVVCLFVAIILGVVSDTARAETRTVITEITAEQLATVLSKGGFDATVRERDEDNNVVDLTFGDSSAAVFVFRDGGLISFFSGYTDLTVTDSVINTWAGSDRLSRTYVSDEGHASMQLNLHMSPGVTRETILFYCKAFIVDHETFLELCIPLEERGNPFGVGGEDPFGDPNSDPFGGGSSMEDPFGRNPFMDDDTQTGGGGSFSENPFDDTSAMGNDLLGEEDRAVARIAKAVDGASDLATASMSPHQDQFQADGKGPVATENVAEFIRQKAAEKSQALQRIPRELPSSNEYRVPSDEERSHLIEQWEKVSGNPTPTENVVADFIQNASANQSGFIQLRLAYLHLCKDLEPVVKAFGAYNYSHTLENVDVARSYLIFSYWLDPIMGWGMNDLAWDLATNPEVGKRDGAAAITLAVEACEAVSWRSWSFLDTLGAALAEDENFEEAIRVARAAKIMAPESQQDYLERVLARYRNGRSQ